MRGLLLLAEALLLGRALGRRLAELMQCLVYKSRSRPNTYLFVAKESDFAQVPTDLLALLGQLDFVMRVELGPGRRLAQADPREVCRRLAGQGYYLQLSPGEPSASRWASTRWRARGP